MAARLCRLLPSGRKNSFPYKNLLFISLSQLFFVSLQCRRTMIIYVSKHKIFRSHGTRYALLPEHQAAVSLAKITRTSCLRPGTVAPYATETSHVSSVRSKHYLPTIRAAIDCPMSVLFRASDFTQPKPLLQSNETAILQTLKFLFPFCITCDILISVHFVKYCEHMPTIIITHYTLYEVKTELNTYYIIIYIINIYINNIYGCIQPYSFLKT